MSKIKVMSENLANKIAAGEVVEKISNVIKELVENSIDALSEVIKVELIDAGKSSIKVIDDGIGMDKDDAKTCFQRHATSKIYRDDDLFFINTLGFRGEALPSIASVSEVVLETFNGIEGTHVHIKGGEIIKEGTCTSRKGTSITVTNLFYNTPARLKYLKSETSELASVISYLEKLALSYPNINFTLTNNGNKILKTNGSGDVLKTIYEIYGNNVASNMLKISASSDDYEISGYVSKPTVTRSTRNHITTIVNGRVVRNNDINKYINEAYYTYKPDNTFPIVVMYIDTDPTLIDVNIHPTKQDIKFSKMDVLKEQVIKSIKSALYENLLIPSVHQPGEKKETNEDKHFNYDEILPKEMLISEPVQEISELKTSKITQEEMDFKAESKNSKIKTLELYPVGIAHGTYVIAENKEGLFLIDQHAAQERVNYEKVLNGLLLSDNIDMLVPFTVELTQSDFLKIKENIAILENIGFSIEEFGINTFKINSHPVWIKEGREEETVRRIFDILLTEKKNFDIVRFNDKVAATIACKMSIKGNTRITLEEAKYIIEQLVLCDNPYTCPHGRPTIIKFTIYELEKMFKRAM